MIQLNNNLFIIIILIGMFSILTAEIRLDSIDSIINWNIIQEEDIQIRWTDYNGYPICQTISVLPFSMESILSIIENVENYPNVFKRIHRTNILEEDIVHVMLDMPLFLSNRDYVIQYKKNKTQDIWEFTFSAVKHINAPESKNYVRLVNAAGKWKLIPGNNNQTSVTYTWNGELLGDFPRFALERAWRTQGNEIIHWLSDALE